MPVAAAGLADVGAADAQPGVLGGGGEERGQKLTVGGLDRGAIGERLPGVADAGREGVAELLELTEVEHPRRPAGADPVRDLDPAEPLGDEAGQLQLELADLAAQLSAGQPLIDLKSVEHSPHN